MEIDKNKMKNTIIFLLFPMLIMGFNESNTRSLKEITARNYLISTERVDSCSYKKNKDSIYFQFPVTYKISNSKAEVLVSGKGKVITISKLIPGSYYLDFGNCHEMLYVHKKNKKCK